MRHGGDFEESFTSGNEVSFLKHVVEAQQMKKYSLRFRREVRDDVDEIRDPRSPHIRKHPIIIVVRKC